MESEVFLEWTDYRSPQHLCHESSPLMLTLWPDNDPVLNILIGGWYIGSLTWNKPGVVFHYCVHYWYLSLCIGWNFPCWFQILPYQHSVHFGINVRNTTPPSHVTPRCQGDKYQFRWQGWNFMHISHILPDANNIKWVSVMNIAKGLSSFITGWNFFPNCALLTVCGIKHGISYIVAGRLLQDPFPKYSIYFILFGNHV